MKHLIYTFIFLSGIPVIAVGAGRSAVFRSLCWAILVGLLGLGHMGGVVNYVSTEHYRGTDRGFELTFTDMFAVGLLISRALGAPLLGKQRRWWPPGYFALAAFVLLGLVGILDSIMPLYGFFTFWKMLRILLLYWVCWSAGCGEVDASVFFKGVFRGLVFGLLVVGLFAMKQKFVDHMYRVNSTFDHSNTIPLYVNLAAGPVLAWMLGDTKMGRAEFIAGFAAVAFALVGVVATQSRLGILLAVVTVGTTLVIANTGSPSRRSRAATVVFVMAGLIGGLLVMQTLMDRIKNAPESSAKARDEFNVAAKEMAADKFFGVGLNNFSITMTEEEKYRAHVEVMADEEQSGVAHHLYLLTAAETGYIGLAVLVAVFLLIELKYLRFILRRRSKAESASLGFLPPVVIATLLGQVALFTSCFFEWAFRITPVMAQFFIVSAVVCAALSRAGLAGAAGLGQAFSRKKALA